MDDPANTENTTDTTLQQRPPRRSSILKLARLPLEGVDQNVSREHGGRCRRSKRVSFSDTHEIKLFNCENSGELAPNSDGVFANAEQSTPKTKTDDPFNGDANLLAPKCGEEHSALEQSFYCTDDAAGNKDTVCRSEKTLILMQDALSCLVFGGASSVEGKDDPSTCPNKSTLASEAMDLTYANVSSAHDCTGAGDKDISSACLKTTLGDKAMDITCASTCYEFHHALTASPESKGVCAVNKTSLDCKTMDITLALASPTLNGMTVDHASLVAGRNSTAGRLNKTMLIHESMDVTCRVTSEAEPTDGSVYLHETMNVTCASRAVDLEADAAASETDIETSVGHHQSARLDLGTFVASMRKGNVRDIFEDDGSPARTASGVTTVSDRTGRAEPVPSLNLASFVALMQKNDAKDALGDDESPIRNACDLATVADSTGTVDPVTLCSLTSNQMMGKNDTLNVLEDDGNNEHCLMDVPKDAAGSNECRTSAVTDEVPKISSVLSSLPVDISMATNYLPVGMSISGFDLSGRDGLNESCPVEGNSSGLAVQPEDAEHSAPYMSLTCAFTGGLGNDSLAPAALPSADVTTSIAIRDKSSGSTLLYGKELNDATGNRNSFSPEKTCLMNVAMDVTCASTAAPLVIEQHAADSSKQWLELADGNGSCSAIKACEHPGKGCNSVEAIEAGNLSDGYGPGGRCSGAYGIDLDSSRESARDCTAAAPGFPNVSVGFVGAVSPFKQPVEPTLTGAPLLLPVSPSVKVTPFEPTVSSTSLPDGVPQECPLPDVGTVPSFREATPGCKDGVRHVESAAVTTPVRPTSSRKCERRDLSSLKRQLASEVEGASVLSGKDSIVLQQLVSPTINARQTTKAASASKPKRLNATSKVDLSAVHRKLNAFLDSTGNISGLDVSALLATTAGDIDSISGDASLPRIVPEKASVLNDGDVVRSSSKSRCQQPNSSMPGSIDSGDGAGSGKTASQVPVAEGEMLASSSRSENGAVLSSSVPCASKVGCNSSVTATIQDSGTAGRVSTSLEAKQQSALSTVCSSKKFAGSTSKSSNRCDRVGFVVNGGAAQKNATFVVNGETIQDSGTVGRVSTSLEAKQQLPLATVCSSKKSAGSTSKSSNRCDRVDTVVNGGAAQKNATFVVNGEHARKSATFVVSSKDARPSATFSVLPSPNCDVVCIDNSVGVEKVGRKAEPLSAPAGASRGPSATSCSTAKSLTARARQSNDTHGRDQSAVTIKSRKRLEFTELCERPKSVQAGTSGDSLKLDLSFDAQAVTSTKAVSELSGQLPFSGHSHSSCRELHTSSAGSSSKIRKQNLSSSCTGFDEEMLVDVQEPSLVNNSPTAASTQDIQLYSGATSHQLTSPQGSKDATLVDGHIPASSFYSTSTAKKRDRPLSVLSPRSSQSSRSKAKKHRLAKSGTKSTSRKGHRTPASSSRKRRASAEIASSDKCKQKAKGQHTPKSNSGECGASLETRSTDKCEQNAEGYVSGSRQENKSRVAVLEKNDDFRTLFACNQKLRSLPPTPPGLIENILSAALPEQEPQEFAGVQSEAGAATQAPLNLPDICEPVEFDTAEVDLTAGINIDDILDRLDDANARERIYWSFTELPEESLKKWALRAIRMQPHKAVFGFINDVVKLAVSLGDFVRQPGSTDKDALAKRAEGAVPRCSKLITALSFQINCKPKARLNQYLLQQHFLNVFKTDELLKRYPTTDCLGKMLGEVGAFFVRYLPLVKDIQFVSRFCPYSLNPPIHTLDIVHPGRLIWFHLDLPIDIDTYPDSEIIPSSRPYSDQYRCISTEKLRRIVAHVRPGPFYVKRIVEEIEAFMDA